MQRKPLNLKPSASHLQGLVTHATRPCFILRLFAIPFSRNLEGDPLFPDGFLDENVDCRRHAHADGVAKRFKVFFQIRVDADTNRCLCHDIPLFLADVLTDHFSLFLDQGFQFGNLLILFIDRVFQAFNLLGHGRLRRRDAAALSNLEAQPALNMFSPLPKFVPRLNMVSSLGR